MLQDCGARVAVFDRTPVDPETNGFKHLMVDVTDGVAVSDAFSDVETELGNIDILVNSAGIFERPLRIEDASDHEWDRVISTNLRGTYLCCKYAGQRMAQRGRGTIVNIASVTGLRPSPSRAYGPAKAAVINLTQVLAAEWATRGVRINAVAPGYIDTPAMKLAVAHGFGSAESFAGVSAQGRLGEPHEVASAVAFLASDLASAVTGVTLPVDCGYLVADAWDAIGGLPISE